MEIPNNFPKVTGLTTIVYLNITSAVKKITEKNWNVLNRANVIEDLCKYTSAHRNISANAKFTKRNEGM